MTDKEYRAELKARKDKSKDEPFKCQEISQTVLACKLYSFVVEKLNGVKLMSLAEIMDLVEDKASFEAILKSADAPAFAIHNPTVVGKLSRKMPLALDEYVRAGRIRSGQRVLLQGVGGGFTWGSSLVTL